MNRTGSPSPSSPRSHLVLAMLFVTAVFAFLLFVTKPISWGDTPVYATDITDFVAGRVTTARIWEFGHLLWRPLGLLIWQWGSGAWLPDHDGDKILQVYSALQLASLWLGFLGALAACGIAWRISANAVCAALVAAAYLGWNANINYLQSGAAYVPGLSLQLVGLYLLLGANKASRAVRAWLAGIALALSVCLWFPYLFSLPGVFLLAYLWNRRDMKWRGAESRDRARWLASAVAVCAMVGAGCYAAGVQMAGVRTLAEARTWVMNAGHGVSPDRNYLRVATGLPRALIEIGDTGLALKRLLTKDPHAPVKPGDLWSTGLWLIALFYAGTASLLWTLARDDQEARPVLFALLLALGVNLFFAIVLFEASLPERWMPVFPSLLPAIAFFFRSRQAMRWSAVPLAALLAAAWVNNVVSYASPDQPGESHPAVARILQAKSRMASGDVLWLMTYRDEISWFRARFPFHPLNRTGVVNARYLIEPGNLRAHAWRRDFAVLTAGLWQQNSGVWISKRLLAERPLPAWGWAEGDDPRLRWREIPAFFGAFTLDDEAGGADGFMRIARDPANHARLEAAAQETGGAD